MPVQMLPPVEHPWPAHLRPIGAEIHKDEPEPLRPASVKHEPIIRPAARVEGGCEYCGTPLPEKANKRKRYCSRLCGMRDRAKR